MTTTLYAQPYDISATGFYFDTAAQYHAKAAKAVNDYGQKVEEFEIQFIDGDEIDATLAKAWELNQVNFAKYLTVVEEWEDHSKIRCIIAMENGFDFDVETDDVDSVDVDIYVVETMRELAEQFVDEGLFGEIPETLQNYIDFDAIARDLAVDYSETTIAGERFVYACR
jgi:antirestriction protein